MRAAIARNTSVSATPSRSIPKACRQLSKTGDNAPDRFSQPLPPGTLTKLRPRFRSSLASVSLMPSLGGRRAEDSGDVGDAGERAPAPRGARAPSGTMSSSSGALPGGL